MKVRCEARQLKQYFWKGFRADHDSGQLDEEHVCSPSLKNARGSYYIPIEKKQSLIANL